MRAISLRPGNAGNRRWLAWIRGSIVRADGGDARAAADVASHLANSKRRAEREAARHYAALAVANATPRVAEVVDHAVVQQLYSDDCGGCDDPRGNGGDPKWAIRALRQLARMGNGHSMYSLSLAYQRGAGVKRDWRAAERWARRAAKHGQSEVLNNIGVAYREGQGVRRDIRRAVSCYRAAIAAGDIVALRNLSRCYRDGEGVRRSDRISLQLLRRAVAANARLPRKRKWDRVHPLACPSAWSDLGSRLVHGEGAPKDRARGLRLIRKAARALHEPAIEMLEELHVPLEPKVAVWWEGRRKSRGRDRSR